MYNISQTNIFKNWDKVCYISSKLPSIEDDYGNQLNQYEEPIKYKFNYQPVVDRKEAEILGYGESSIGLIRALIDIKYKDKIKQYDLAYLYDATPDNESYIGENANYRVVTCKPQNTKILVYFEELTKLKEVHDEN